MPMPANLYAKVKGAYDFAIDFLGVYTTYTNASGTQTRTAIVGFRNLGRDDTELVNAYGPGVVAITCAREDFPDAPGKFDQFVINGMTYIVQAAHQATLNANVVGWRVYATGK